VNSGAHDDTVNVQTIGAATTVNAGEGADTINVGSLAPAVGGTVNAIDAPLTVNGNGGIDTLNVDDTGDVSANTFALTATTLTGLGMSDGITYGTLEHLNLGLGTGPQTANIQSVGAATVINFGGADDTVTLGSLAPDLGGTLNGFAAPLTLNAGGGNDVLNIDDSGDTDPDSGTLAADTLSGFGMAGDVTYRDFETLELSLGSGGNELAITSTMRREDFRTVTVVNAGAGNDAVTVSLDADTDGLTAVNLQAGDDVLDGTASSLELLVFGGDGADTILGGSAADLIFGDRGVVEYRGAGGGLVTRLGIAPAERSDDPNDQHFVPVPMTDGGFHLRGIAATRDPQSGGADTIHGNGGEDLILGGAGGDSAYGDAGADIVFGDGGVDW
jgi:acrosin